MFFKKIDKNTIDEFAIKSLLDTLNTFLPGLNTHIRDNFSAYKNSIEYLNGIFGMLFELGVEYSCVESGLCFDTMRIKGKVIENKLANVTGEVRTHFGALFALGLLSCTVGKLDALGIELQPEYIITLIADFTKNYTYKSFINLSTKTADLTDGEKLYLKNGNASIRSLAEMGFSPIINASFDFLQNHRYEFEQIINGENSATLMLSSNASMNKASIQLFALVASLVDDSRVILQHGEDVMREIQAKFKELFVNYSDESARSLDDYLNQHSILPKAAMGMHSLCLFFFRIILTYLPSSLESGK